MTISREVEVVFDGLRQIPHLLFEVRTAVASSRALLSTPQAAMATGSMPMSAAIVGLGIELAVFVVQTIDAIDDDIDALQETLARYGKTDDAVKAQGQAGQQAVAALTQPTAPQLTAPQSVVGVRP